MMSGPPGMGENIITQKNYLFLNWTIRLLGWEDGTFIDGETSLSIYL